MFEELVKELRDSAEWADRLAVLMGRAEGDAHAPIMRKAADAIEKLQKRVPKRPHGRLIDADALMKRMWEETDCMISVPATFVRDAPTIIPEEEGET